MQTQAVPPWQIAAGGKMEFEVASIKLSKPGWFTPPNFPLDVGDAYGPTGGRFSADFRLDTYVRFAYKVSLTHDQIETMLAPLPKWVATDAFDIQARAEGNPTKDQMRLMMQSLLADRFRLAAHFENRQGTLLALFLVKSGKTGPKLRPHADGIPCDASSAPPANVGKRTEVFPPVCDVYEFNSTSNGVLQAGSRNTTLELLAGALPSLGRLGRPVVDRTGLRRKFDFTLEWTREADVVPPPAGDVRPDSQGPNFLEALREQLGLKLESTKGPVRTLVIDRVERPSEN